MVRPSNKAARRAQLVESALGTIQERGIDGLRIRDVAEAAGVSTATVHYYFDDLDGLLDDVHAVATERYFTERLAAISKLDDARQKVRAMVDGGLPLSSDDAPVAALYQAIYQLGAAKRTDPTRAQLGRILFDRQVGLYLGILDLGVSQGHFVIAGQSYDIAQNLIGLEDAYAMHIIDGNASLPRERCRDLILGYARLATNCAEL